MRLPPLSADGIPPTLFKTILFPPTLDAGVPVSPPQLKPDVPASPRMSTDNGVDGGPVQSTVDGQVVLAPSSGEAPSASASDVSALSDALLTASTSTSETGHHPLPQRQSPDPVDYHQQGVSAEPPPQGPVRGSDASAGLPDPQSSVQDNDASAGLPDPRSAVRGNVASALSSRASSPEVLTAALERIAMQVSLTRSSQQLEH